MQPTEECKLRNFPSLILCLAMSTTGALAREPVRPFMTGPIPDAERGKFLFATKGCVSCHSVNGVGGTYAPPLDAEETDNVIRPLGLAARMWRGAETMLALQLMEFGYQIELSGVDIADLAAFAANRDLQSTFTESDIPDVMRGWSVDELPRLKSSE